MPSSELKYTSVNRGVTAYNREAIARTRARSQGNKAHIRKKGSPFKKLVYEVAFAGLIVVSVATAILAICYRGEMDKNNMAIYDNYIKPLGKIMENHSESEILEIANQAILAATKLKGPEALADINAINTSLAKITELKGKDKDMSQEISWQLSSILSIASRYGVFLSGYDFSLPSFLDYSADSIKSIIP